MATLVQNYLSIKSNAPFLILVILVFSSCKQGAVAEHDESGRNTTKTVLTLKRDSLNYQTTFFLTINGVLADSTTLSNVNSSMFDSISSLGDTLWHYMYASCYSWDDEKKYEQVLIEVLEQRIHFSYVGDYMEGNMEKLDTVTNIKIGESFTHYRHDLIITDTGVCVKYWKNVQRFYPGSSRFPMREGKPRPYKNDSIVIDSLEGISYLQYDTASNIFYNAIDTLNGVYYLSPKPRMTNSGYESPSNIKEELFFINKQIKTIKFIPRYMYTGTYTHIFIHTYAFIDGKWFYISGSLGSPAYMEPLQSIE